MRYFERRIAKSSLPDTQQAVLWYHSDTTLKEKKGENKTVSSSAPYLPCPIPFPTVARTPHCEVLLHLTSPGLEHQ
jgi:hypothetical protein